MAAIATTAEATLLDILAPELCTIRTYTLFSDSNLRAVTSEAGKKCIAKEYQAREHAWPSLLCEEFGYHMHMQLLSNSGEKEQNAKTRYVTDGAYCTLVHTAYAAECKPLPR